MTKERPLLIIIPGVGDDLPIYQTFARRWNRLGFDTHIISFGWIEHHAQLWPKMEAFLKQLDAFGDRPLYIIGVSAGGSAAIQLLRHKSTIKKVITVCAPLDTFPNLQNPLLVESIAETKRHLQAMDTSQKQRILSVYALYDNVVDTRLSRPGGIATKRVFAIIHAPAIFISLMLYARSLRQFMHSEDA